MTLLSVFSYSNKINQTMPKLKSLSGSDIRSDVSGATSSQKQIKTMPGKMLSNLNKIGVGPICCDYKKGWFSHTI